MVGYVKRRRSGDPPCEGDVMRIEQDGREYECTRCYWCGTWGMVLIDGVPYCKSRCAPQVIEEQAYSIIETLKGPYLDLTHPKDHPIPKKLIEELRQLIGTLRGRAGIPKRRKKQS